MIRKAKAVWRGTGRSGNGHLSTDSGVLAETPYSYKTRFENEKGTNPEELIAAAHAGCFTVAIAFQMHGAGYTPNELTTEAAVSLEPEGQGFRITRSALTLRASVPNLDEAKFREGRCRRKVVSRFQGAQCANNPGCQAGIAEINRASVLRSCRTVSEVCTGVIRWPPIVRLPGDSSFFPFFPRAFY